MNAQRAPASRIGRRAARWRGRLLVLGVVSTSAILVSAATYPSSLIPDGVPTNWVAFAMMIVITLLWVRRSSPTGWITAAMLFLELAVILVFTVYAFAQVSPDGSNVRPPTRVPAGRPRRSTAKMIAMMTSRSGDDQDIVLIGDPLVTDIPTAEFGEPLVDVTDEPSLRMDHRLADPAGNYRRLRSGVVTRLVTAGQGLTGGLRICVVEGFRPRSLQTRYFNEYVNRLRGEHPEWDAATLTRLASRHVAPPSRASPHSTGGAVDLTLVDGRGQELDMGTPVNATPEESEGRCYTHAPGLSGEARRNRAVLQDVLDGVGLVNYPTEWWHWSYGDQYWALRTAAPTTRYREIAAVS